MAHLPFSRLLFFYGTLMKGEGRSATVERLGARLVGPGKIRGDLYSVGDSFPAFVGGAGEIVGEVWACDDDATLARVLAATDAIEGYRPEDPAGSMYLRELHLLVESPPALPTATTPVVMTYRWRRAPDRWMTPIRSGDWRAHIARVEEERKAGLWSGAWGGEAA